MLSNYNIKLHNLLFAFILFLPNMIVLNLPQFNMKVAGISMGAFFIYISGILLFFIKIQDIIDKTLIINQTLLCLLAILLLLMIKQLQSSQPLERFLMQLPPFLLMPLFFVLGQVFIKQEKDRKKLVKVLLVNTLIGSIIGLAHFYFFPDFQLYDSSANVDEFFSVVDYETMKVRETSTYSTPVSFSHNMAFGIVFLLMELKHRQFKWATPLPLLMTVIAIFGIYVSYSRAALLFICILTMYCFIGKRKGLAKYVQYLFLFLSTVAIAVYSIAGVAGRLSLSAENISGEIRWLKWYIALREIFASLSNFLFGVDIGNEVTMDGISFSDNYYILHQLRFGLLGMVILYIALRCIYKKIKVLLASHLTDFDTYYVKSVYAIGYAALFFAFFSNILLMVPTNIYLPILMGSLWNIKRVSAG
jgi:hypothetical protein